MTRLEDVFNLNRYLTVEGRIRYAAAQRTTVLYRATPGGPYLKLCTVIFSKKDGSVFAQFTHYRSGPGIAASVNVTVGQDGTSQINLGESGKVASSLLKYSHPPDGRAHLSQDTKATTTFWSQSIRLDRDEGHLFEIHAHNLEPFEAFETSKPDKDRLYLPFQAARPTSAVSLVVEWRSKQKLQEWAEAANARLDLISELPRQRDGRLFKAAILGQPAGFPLRQSVLLVNVHPLDAIPSIAEPMLFLMGGWSPDFRNPHPGATTTLLAFQYPASNPDELRRRVGSIDR